MDIHLFLPNNFVSSGYWQYSRYANTGQTNTRE